MVVLKIRNYDIYIIINCIYIYNMKTLILFLNIHVHTYDCQTCFKEQETTDTCTYIRTYTYTCTWAHGCVYIFEYHGWSGYNAEICGLLSMMTLSAFGMDMYIIERIDWVPTLKFGFIHNIWPHSMRKCNHDCHPLRLANWGWHTKPSPQIVLHSSPLPIWPYTVAGSIQFRGAELWWSRECMGVVQLHVARIKEASSY